MFGAAHEMRGCPALVIDGKIDDPKVVWGNLFAHQDSADFSVAGISQQGTEALPLVIGKTDRDHRMPLV